MKKYMILDSVETFLIKPESVQAAATRSALNAIGSAIIPPVVMLGVAGVATGLILAKLPKDKSITKISTVDELLYYKNGVSNEWKRNVLYYEHPCRPYVLIEESIYKDYIVREMVADISNYIADHLDLKMLVIGVVSSSHMDANIPVSQINVNTKFKCRML